MALGGGGASFERGTSVGAGVLGFECRVQGCKVEGGGWRVEGGGFGVGCGGVRVERVELGIRVWGLVLGG